MFCKYLLALFKFLVVVVTQFADAFGQALHLCFYSSRITAANVNYGQPPEGLRFEGQFTGTGNHVIARNGAYSGRVFHRCWVVGRQMFSETPSPRRQEMELHHRPGQLQINIIHHHQMDL